jgi:hypothetical protein
MRGIIGRQIGRVRVLSTTDEERRRRERELAEEAMRLADWDAKHGLKHLRAGRFKPEEQAPGPLEAAE